MVVSAYIEVQKADVKLNKEKSITHTQKSMEIFEPNTRSLWSLSNRVDEILEILLLNTISDRNVRKVHHYLPLFHPFVL